MKAVMSGVYFLLDHEEIVYVGQTTDVYRRIYEHRSGRTKGEKKEFDRWEFIEEENGFCRDRMEAFFINLLNPKYNKDIPYYSERDFWQDTRSEKVNEAARVFRTLPDILETVSCQEVDRVFEFPHGTFSDYLMKYRLQLGNNVRWCGESGGYRITRNWLADHFGELWSVKHKKGA